MDHGFLLCLESILRFFSKQTRPTRKLLSYRKRRMPSCCLDLIEKQREKETERIRPEKKRKKNFSKSKF